MRLHRVRIVALAALVLGIAVQAGMAHAPKGKKGGKGAKHSHAEQIHELHQVRALLESANYDYNGHRAKAVHHITQAIHDLEAAHGHHGKKGHSKHRPGIREKQRISDDQLQQAAGTLATIQKQLAAAPDGKGAKASGHLDSAVKELHVALQISKKFLR
jgi:hypothetical protein